MPFGRRLILWYRPISLSNRFAFTLVMYSHLLLHPNKSATCNGQFFQQGEYTMAEFEKVWDTTKAHTTGALFTSTWSTRAATSPRGSSRNSSPQRSVPRFDCSA